MESTQNKYITVAYKLYATDEGGDREMVEEAKADHPFQFISGMGTTLDFFENEITKLAKGEKFDFDIPVEEAYGMYIDEYVIDLPKNIFEVDGRIDTEMIKEGNIVPMMDAEGHRMNGVVVEVKEDVVVMDMNHPLAGSVLSFVGEVIENRDATPEEIQGMINMMSGGGCNCGCDSDDCDSDCGGSCH